MKISIITVCFNSARTIRQTIESVVKQTYDNIEYIIIDGGSTDGTVDIIKKYENNINYWISETDKGIYDAMNKGIDKANGDIIGIINSDDWYTDNNVIKEVIEAFNKNNVDIIHGNLIYVNEIKNERFRILPDLKVENIYRKMVFNHPTCFIKRNVYKRFGTFDLRYNITADYELLLRFYTHMNASRFFYLDKDMVCFRYGGIRTKNIYLTLLETYKVSTLYGNSKFIAIIIFFKNLLKSNLKSIFQQLKLDFLISFYRNHGSRYHDI